LLLDILDQKKAVLEKFKNLRCDSVPLKASKASELEKNDAAKKKKEEK
jgi:hypothetical protein